MRDFLKFNLFLLGTLLLLGFLLYAAVAAVEFVVEGDEPADAAVAFWLLAVAVAALYGGIVSISAGVSMHRMQRAVAGQGHPQPAAPEPEPGLAEAEADPEPAAALSRRSSLPSDRRRG